jgi:sugar phosphate isomerase/epimerase
VLISEIGHVHFKDFLKTQDGTGLASTDGSYYAGVTCGEGAVPLAGLMERLSAHDYQGYVSLEFEGSGDEVDGVLNSFAYLRSLSETVHN